MGLLNKLKAQKEFEPKERTEAAAKEINTILKKYHCMFDVKQTIVILPLELKDGYDRVRSEVLSGDNKEG